MHRSYHVLFVFLHCSQYFPQSAWVEHDPEEIWATTRDIIKETLDKSGQFDVHQACGSLGNRLSVT